MVPRDPPDEAGRGRLARPRPSRAAGRASSIAFSITVFPEPRAPVYSVARPGAPGPSSSASSNSSISASRPASRGGLTPKLGLNGFAIRPGASSSLYSPLVFLVSASDLSPGGRPARAALQRFRAARRRATGNRVPAETVQARVQTRHSVICSNAFQPDTRFPVALLRPLGHLSGPGQGIRQRRFPETRDHSRWERPDVGTISRFGGPQPEVR